MLVEFVKFKKKHTLGPIDRVMEDGKPRNHHEIVSAVIDLPTHKGGQRRVIPTSNEAIAYLKNNPKYEYKKIKEMRIWKMKI